MLKTVTTLMAFGFLLTLATPTLPLGDVNPLAANSAHAGLWSKVKKKAKSAAKSVAKGAKKVGRVAKRVAKDQVNGAKIGWKTTKKFFGKDGVKIRCCGYGRIGELPPGTKGYATRDHRGKGTRDHRRLRIHRR